MASGAPPERRWFFGPASDLLLGCGLLYAFFFTFESLAGPVMRTALPYGLWPLLTLLFGAPHYGATLLRVYEQRADRRKYALFAVWVTLALALAYVAGLRHEMVGSLLVTLYLTWSPWHYSGQNYGIAVLFLRRRGVEVPDRAKRFLWASFVLSYLLTFLALHGATEGQAYAPAAYDGTVYRLLSLEIPQSIHVPLFVAVEIAYIASVGAAGWWLVPLAGWRRLAPTAVVVGTQALWFAVPTVAIQFGAFQGLEPLQVQHRAYAFIWVALGHFLQYLWITTFYAVSSQRPAARVRYLGKALLAGTAVWVLPTFVFAPGLLGELPFDLGLAVLTASVVNLHHFILDGAIWKLRDGRVARILLRDPGGNAAGDEGGAGRSGWMKRSLLATGALCWIVSMGLLLDYQLGKSARDAGDEARLRETYERRAWFGRDSPRVRARLARRALREGDEAAALLDLERSLELHPTVEAFLLRGVMFRRSGDWTSELDAYQAALALDPDRPESLHRRGMLWLRRGRPDLASRDLARARELAPDDPAIAEAWQRLEAGGGPPTQGPKASSAE